ncbi:S-adenosylmethionine sensor upstream of mTORC1 [Ctenocephalides felis]|uniref:S-adenosylmethionine sensor upstream of mTORC1 n=1 Tax=Ctenocephalides felis TaxID=7515 RepID=UPI000E6E54F0|nr:S-adenosylmethionine sensor upstream of mTORC1 [Ctenocephalides felis]
MDSDRQDLSAFVKNVHKTLRLQSSKLGADKAWIDHCLNETTLKKYAESMQTLATLHWDNKDSKELSANSRNAWIVKHCQQYFFENGIENQRTREYKIIELLNMGNKNYDELNLNGIIRMLDVGSCYNPFKDYDMFDVVAVDIAPANASVYKCDFICQDEYIVDNAVCKLNNNSFHTVVFSLLLDYLPSSELRLKCCQKAYDLLKIEGIMIIILPDSKHVGANAKFMKCWRYTLSTLGFSRIKYEKLTHIHCMVFRKSLSPKVPQRWAEIHKYDEFDVVPILAFR